ncbi:MAG: hypothetical protein AB8B72_14315 [Crocinitomicaceae bacterium]
MTKSKTVKRIFIGLLILNFLMELIVSLGILINFPLAVKVGFGINYTDDMATIGIGLGSNLALTAVVFLLSIIWTIRNKTEGVILGIAGAGMLILFASLTFLQLGDTSGLLADGIRGALTVTFGYLTLKPLQKSE